MATAHDILGVIVCVAFALATALGAWRWRQARTSELFWRLLRAAQAALLVEVALGGVLELQGRHASGLHLLYGLLPLLVSFAAEQLRVSSAEAVLAARGYETPEAVGRLAAEEQRGVVLAILQRELGVMTLGAFVVLLLVLRAATVPA